MALSNTWSTTAAQGSQANYGFGIRNPDGSPYPITGLTWEYVIRSPDGRTTVSITTTPSDNGQLTVTTSGQSLVQLTIAPDATSGISAGSYSHALWSNPGTDTAFLWVTGALIVQAVAQP